MKYSAIRTSAMKVLKETVNGLKGKESSEWLNDFNADTASY
jgi:hypothetical protein